MLTRDRLAEIIHAAAERRPDDSQYEKLRGYVGLLLDELSVAGSIIGNWTAREMQREGALGDSKKIEELRFTRIYAEKLVKAGSNGLKR